jgi:hypothetical protein
MMRIICRSGRQEQGSNRQNVESELRKTQINSQLQSRMAFSEKRLGRRQQRQLVSTTFFPASRRWNADKSPNSKTRTDKMGVKGQPDSHVFNAPSSWPTTRLIVCEEGEFFITSPRFVAGQKLNVLPPTAFDRRCSAAAPPGTTNSLRGVAACSAYLRRSLGSPRRRLAASGLPRPALVIARGPIRSLTDR